MIVDTSEISRSGDQDVQYLVPRTPSLPRSLLLYGSGGPRDGLRTCSTLPDCMRARSDGDGRRWMSMARPRSTVPLGALGCERARKEKFSGRGLRQQPDAARPDVATGLIGTRYLP